MADQTMNQSGVPSKPFLSIALSLLFYLPRNPS